MANVSSGVVLEKWESFSRAQGIALQTLVPYFEVS